MRTVEVTLGETVYSMPVNFHALEQIAIHVGDPFKIAPELAKGGHLTAIQAINVIAIGVRLAGCQLDIAKIGDAIVDAGAFNFLLPASKYLLDVASGAPLVPIADKKKAAVAQ